MLSNAYVRVISLQFHCSWNQKDRFSIPKSIPQNTPEGAKIVPIGVSVGAYRRRTTIRTKGWADSSIG